MSEWRAHFRRGRTHGDPSGNEIDLVEDVDDLLAALFLGEVSLDTLATRSHGITSIEDVQEEVGRIDDLTESAESQLLLVSADIAQRSPCTALPKYASKFQH